MTEAHYSIRSAHADELPQIQAIEKAAAQRFRNTVDAWIADDDGMALESLTHWLLHGRIWVAVDAQDKPVGFVVAHEIDSMAYIHELDVAPAHGRQGLGRRLIETVAVWGRTCGYPALLLSTFVDIPWNAPYYQRLGFRRLDEAELGVGLQAIREQEAAAGLDLTRRVCMLRLIE
ncbi:MAG: GNAT family N-acetyltransferase [Caldilineaceae bacterium]